MKVGHIEGFFFLSRRKEVKFDCGLSCRKELNEEAQPAKSGPICLLYSAVMPFQMVLNSVGAVIAASRLSNVILEKTAWAKPRQRPGGYSFNWLVFQRPTSLSPMEVPVQREDNCDRAMSCWKVGMFTHRMLVGFGLAAPKKPCVTFSTVTPAHCKKCRMTGSRKMLALEMSSGHAGCSSSPHPPHS